MAFEEGRPLVPGTPESRDDRISELRELDRTLNAVGALDSLRQAVRAVGSIRGHRSRAYIVTLDASDRNSMTVDIRPVIDSQSSAIYRDAESNAKANSVLVEVDRAEDLALAYPNYFLDVGDFSAFVRRAIGDPALQGPTADGLVRFLRREPSLRRQPLRRKVRR